MNPQKPLNIWNQMLNIWGVLVLLKFQWASDIVKFVLGRFSHFNIAIVYSNSTFCGAWAPSFCEFSSKLSKFQENEHTPGLSYQILKYSLHPKSITRNSLQIMTEAQDKWLFTKVEETHKAHSWAPTYAALLKARNSLINFVRKR